MSSRAVKAFRVASLAIAPAGAWWMASQAPHGDRVAEVVTYVLGPLWLAIAAGLLLRAVPRRGSEVPALDRLDVLTASGSGTLWIGALAVVLATKIGWASLAVLGVMGLSVVALTLVWTLLAAGSMDPMKLAAIERGFAADSVTEGEAVIERVRVAGARIPVGFRLFLTGKVGPRWPVSRYAVDASASGGEVVLESELGPGFRGAHHAPPLDVWLGDVLGLCKSVRRRAGAATLTVLPRLRKVEGARKVAGRGGLHTEPRAALRLPTEGVMRLKEYQPGDDARRIHWMRSLSAREVVVRMPDEVPRDMPRVRLVLDTFLPGAEELTCDAHHELLDGLVNVWLGAARALSEGGNRVTLVTAAPGGESVAARALALSPRSFAPALALGAEVRWQEDLGVDDLVTEANAKETTVIVSCRLQADPAGANAAWIAVPRSLWTHVDDAGFVPSYATLPYVPGSPENRGSARRRERARVRLARRHAAALVDLCADSPNASKGRAVVARPVAGNAVTMEGDPPCPPPHAISLEAP
jgi:uncharacterized protein (DUF58 family)